MTTNLLGTIADSMGQNLNGTLEITLAGLMIDLTTTPDKISTNRTSVVTITSGVVNINLQESASSGISYHFVFKDTLAKIWMDFYAIVPDGLGCQYCKTCLRVFSNIKFISSYTKYLLL